MKSQFTHAILCLSALAWAGQTQPAVADDLFSSIPIDTVFTPPSADAKTTPARSDEKAERVQRVLNITQLTDILRDAGLEPEAEEAAVLVKLQQSRWTFPIVLGLDEQREQIVMLVRLADFNGKTPLSSERLLALLSASRELRPAFFSYSEKNKRVELMMSLDNDSISPRLMREELRRLSQMAENTASLWEVTAASNVAAAPAAGGKPAGQNITLNTNSARQNAAAPAAASAASSLLGKWSAARSEKEAFAIQLNADNSFVLVYVKDGKQSRSSGQFTLASGQLTLTGSDGTKFSGSVSGVTAKTFEFTPPNTAKLTFQKAA